MALAQVKGPEAALKSLESIRKTLDHYYLLHAVIAEFHHQLGDKEAERKHLQKALDLTPLKSEHQFLQQKLHET